MEHLDDCPKHIELRRSEGLELHWKDGSKSFFPIAMLRRMSPSADARALRDALAANPLTVIPSSASNTPLAAIDAELVGNYAIRIRFNDGHDTGLYSWKYLCSIDPDRANPREPRG